MYIYILDQALDYPYGGRVRNDRTKTVEHTPPRGLRVYKKFFLREFVDVLNCVITGSMRQVASNKALV